MEENKAVKIRLKDNQSFDKAYYFAENPEECPEPDEKMLPEEWWDAMKGMGNINTLLEKHKLITIPQRSKFKNYAIFDRINDRLYTYNWAGVIAGKKEDGTSCRIEICSRFDEGDKQYFLLYMLCNICGINVFDLHINSETESDYTAVLVLLFLMKLSNAYGEGLYKEYVRNRYNDFNFRGSFDIDRHILRNNPFVGKTAYSVREYSYDNDVLCLIRQTAEYIMDRYPEIGNGYIRESAVLGEIMDVIETATPSYRMNVNYAERIRCQREITNPLYRNYEDARKMALMILRETGQNIFDNEDDESAGVLIDIAWLWEEFIAVKLLDGNKYRHLLTDGSRGRLEWAKGENWYPDFIEDKTDLRERRKVFDAKYKYWKWNKDGDVHQLLSYLLLTGGEACGIIYPYEEEQDFEVKEIAAFDGFYETVKAKIYRMPLFVPESSEGDFREYCERIGGAIDNWKKRFDHFFL